MAEGDVSMTRAAETLLLFPGALGDAVCLEPTVAELARRGPVTLYARGAGAQVARLFPDRPEVRSLDAPEVARLFAPLEPSEPTGGGGWLDRFARIVSFTGAGVAEVEVRLAATGRAVVAPFPRHATGVHASDHFLGFATGERGRQAPAPRLTPPAAPPGGTANPGGRLLVVHPGASSLRKRVPGWLLEALCRRWRASGGRVLVLLGPAESGLDDLGRGLGDETVRPPDVMALAGSLAIADAFVASDSGPAHVAAALGVRGLVIYTTTDPEHFGPRSPRLAMLRVTADGAPAARLADLAWARLAAMLP